MLQNISISNNQFDNIIDTMYHHHFWRIMWHWRLE